MEFLGVMTKYLSTNLEEGEDIDTSIRNGKVSVDKSEWSQLGSHKGHVTSGVQDGNQSGGKSQDIPEWHLWTAVGPVH